MTELQVIGIVLFVITISIIIIVISLSKYRRNKSCNKRKVKDDCFGGVDRRRSKRLTVDRG